MKKMYKNVQGPPGNPYMILNLTIESGRLRKERMNVLNHTRAHGLNMGGTLPSTLSPC